jgi:hypothetical protein
LVIGRATERPLLSIFDIVIEMRDAEVLIVLGLGVG